MNTPITAIGNLAADPELRFVASGQAVLNGSAAVNRRRYNKNTTQWEDAGTDWYRFSLWGAKAEAAVEVLTKGTRVIVVGELESREYEAQDGTKRTVWEIRATEVGVVPKAKASNGGYTPAGTSTQADPWAQPAQGVSDASVPF